MKLESQIKLHVSGKAYTVNAEDVTPQTTLNTYLRDILNLRGTKKMCLEGGCGVCIVAVEEYDGNGTKRVLSVNSCLVSIFSCHGWKVLSIEGIGNPLVGYHPIQKLLADNNGTQCGFCSSSMVMNMYAYHESGPKSEKEIESAFGGNLCRCTGYRPILTAFKQLAVDRDQRNEKLLQDIEDLKACQISAQECKQNCEIPCNKNQKIPVYFELKDHGSKWMKIYTVRNLLQVLKTIGNQRYQLVGGNTARGVYWQTVDSLPDVYIDITSISELTGYAYKNDALVLGGNITLTNTIEIFKRMSAQSKNFRYLLKMAEHIELVAHVPVRNIGTIAGNLSIKYQHNEFQSDIFLILETVNATLVIWDSEEKEIQATPAEYLKIDMNKKLIKQIILKEYDVSYYYQSYKVLPRAQNAHAQVNAGFLYQLNAQGIVQSARIVFGAINPKFVHATKTENLLKGKKLFNNDTLQLAFQSLEKEINPDWVQPDPGPNYRRNLAISLFYKGILSLAPKNIVSLRNRLGGEILTRPVSTSSQQIVTDPAQFPLTQPIIKVEALAQTTGEAQYVVDLPDLPYQLHAALVTAEAPAGSTLTKIDDSLALAVPGVVAFYSAKDIPGLNNIKVSNILQMLVDEELFCSKVLKYYHQPVGVVVANTHEIALLGASLVKVTTIPPPANQAPLLHVRDILAKGRNDRVDHQTSVLARSTGKDIKATIKGQTYLSGQYHFHMETQDCQVIPTEDGYDIYPGTQWMDYLQGLVAQVLNIPSQRINIMVRRVGGAFGAKITRPGFIVGAAALAASKLRRPVHLWMSFYKNMEAIGKRYPMLCNYKVGVNGKGVIQFMESELYSDYGVGGNEPVDDLVVRMFQNVYKFDTWNYDTYFAHTDTPANSYARGPGTVEAIGSIETIMEHIAMQLNLDPLDVRLANLDAENNPIIVNFLKDIRESGKYDQRKKEIAQFNAENRWRKRGLSVIPMRWVVAIDLNNFTVLVSIFHLDGGVAVSHGGIEMGQGINTKVVQVTAYKFGIPIEKVQVKPSYTLVAPNSFTSGASFTSEAVVYALLRACDVLIARMNPVRQKNPNSTWEELVQICYSKSINLSTNGFYSPSEPDIKEYPVYGICMTEVEVDLLTANHLVTKVDILEDVGQSMSPLIDIGQLEGAFVMGLGYHTTEELKMDQDGRLTTNRTWNYKVPGFQDIPVDFSVRFSNNTPNPVGVLKSKAIAEPPICLAISIPLAIRQALASARKEADPKADPWFPIDGPTTVENVHNNTLHNYKQYTL